MKHTFQTNVEKSNYIADVTKIRVAMPHKDTFNLLSFYSSSKSVL